MAWPASLQGGVPAPLPRGIEVLMYKWDALRALQLIDREKPNSWTGAPHPGLAARDKTARPAVISRLSQSVCCVDLGRFAGEFCGQVCGGCRMSFEVNLGGFLKAFRRDAFQAEHPPQIHLKPTPTLYYGFRSGFHGGFATAIGQTIHITFMGGPTVPDNCWADLGWI